ncbi:MAG: hypothetical protein ACFB21_10270 [Opitutales bacterium]
MAEKSKLEVLAGGAFYLCLGVMALLFVLGQWTAALAWIAPTLGAWILSRWSRLEASGDPEAQGEEAADEGTEERG